MVRAGLWVLMAQRVQVLHMLLQCRARLFCAAPSTPVGAFVVYATINHCCFQDYAPVVVLVCLQ